MFKKNIFRSKLLLSGLLAGFLMLLLPLEVLSQGTGALTGIIYWEDVKTPVENALVKIRNLQTGKEYQSPPSDKNGLYLLKDIPEGRYILGVTTSKGDFNFNFEVFIKAGETARLSLALKAEESLVVLERAGKKGFFAKPAGIALMVGGAGLVALGGYELFKGKEEKSPTKK
jgi:hypothetical protein